MHMPETNEISVTSPAPVTPITVVTGTAKPAEKISTADSRVAGASFMSVRREHVGPPTPVLAPPAKRSFRLGVELKALLPVAAVLLNGLLLFLLVSLSWNYPQRHVVITVAAAGAVVICV